MKSKNDLFPFLQVLISKETGLPIIFNTKTEKEVKSYIAPNGYMTIHVNDKDGLNHTMTLGRLVLTLTQPLEDYKGMECDHIDRNPLNDRLDNLRWVTKSENMKNRSFTKEKSPKRKILILFDDGGKMIYDYSMSKHYFIGYNTLYKLASGSQGKNYSEKYRCTVSWYLDYSDASLF